MQFIGLSLLLLAVPGAGTDTLVVGPPTFAPAMTPWIEYRQAQGHAIQWLDAAGSAAEIAAAIRETARHEPLKFVVLIGDAPDKSSTPRASDPRTTGVPTHYAAAKVNIQWGGEPWIATDAPYGDIDEDGVPDLAVGRFTAHDPGELARMIGKAIAHENSTAETGWQSRVNVVAGASGFGPWVDTVLETTARRLIGECIPTAYQASMTYANWRSPYCPPPALFNRTTLARHNEGCLFWVYVGHGQRRYVDGVHTPVGIFPILSARDAAQLRAEAAPPIALLMACYTGAYDGADDCLGETLLSAPGGPAAVICGSRVTMPYAMTVMATLMMEECFVRHQPTLGELMLATKRRMILEPRDDPDSKLIDGLAALLNPLSKDLAAERREHVALFNTLGDPLLRVARPKTLEIACRWDENGGGLIVSGTSPLEGTVIAELVRSREQLPFTAPRRETFDPENTESQRQYLDTYRRANDVRLSAVETRTTSGSFRALLPPATGALDNCQVRVIVCGPGGCAAGSQKLPPARGPATAAIGSPESAPAQR